MVLDDVAQRSNGVVEGSTVLDAEVLRHGDLDPRNVLPPPQRLERSVAKAQVDEIAQWLLAEEVIHAEDVLLVHLTMEPLVQGLRRLEVVPEGFLDEERCTPRERRASNRLHDGAEECRRHFEVHQDAPDRTERGAQGRIGSLGGEVARHVAEPRREAIQHRPLRVRDGRADGFAHVGTQVIIAPRIERDTHDRNGEQTTLLQPVQRRKRHLACEVAGDPEHHHRVHTADIVRYPHLGSHRTSRISRGASAQVPTSQSACGTALAGSAAIARRRQSRAMAWLVKGCGWGCRQLPQRRAPRRDRDSRSS